MSLNIITPPAVEPVDLVLAKTFLRADHDHEDELITSLIKSARERIEALLGRVLIQRRLQLSLPIDIRPLVPIKPVPIITLESVSATDDDGNSALIDPASYRLNMRREPAELCLRTGHQWNSELTTATTLSIIFDAGYGPDPADVPMPLRQAILLIVSQSYTYRDSLDTLSLPLMVDALIMPYRGYRL